MRRFLQPAASPLAALIPATLALVALGLVTLSLACTTSVKIRIDDEALAGHRSWNFLPRETRNVQAATAQEAPALELRVERLVAEALRAQGFHRVHRQPDFYVTFAIRVHEQLVTIYETRAEHELASLHGSPSFAFQQQRARLVPYERSQLVISAVDRRLRRVVWRGEFHSHTEETGAPQLGESVARLFASFPVAASEPPLAPKSPEPAPSRLRMLANKLLDESRL